MEALTLLEQKVLLLVSKVSELNRQNELLKTENMDLKEKNDALEEALLLNTEEKGQEEELTRMVVEGLIQNVDSVLARQLAE
jgi:hypothetical protein